MTGAPISGILSGLVVGRELDSNQSPIVVEAISTISLLYDISLGLRDHVIGQRGLLL